jgi:hypothetical protein
MRDTRALEGSLLDRSRINPTKHIKDWVTFPALGRNGLLPHQRLLTSSAHRTVFQTIAQLHCLIHTLTLTHSILIQFKRCEIFRKLIHSLPGTLKFGKEFSAAIEVASAIFSLDSVCSAGEHLVGGPRDHSPYDGHSSFV